MQKIYLALAYKGKEEKNFKIANKIASILLKHNFIVYSPISHCHPIARQEGLPVGYDFWQKYDEAFIDWCDSIYVYEKGWKESEGVNKEIEYAKKSNKEVLFIESIIGNELIIKTEDESRRLIEHL